MATGRKPESKKVVTYRDLVTDVLEDGRPQSAQYIIKSIAYTKNLETRDVKRYIKAAIKKMKSNNQIIQVKGIGMSGSFRLNKSPVKPKNGRRLPKADSKRSDKLHLITSNNQAVSSKVVHESDSAKSGLSNS